MAMIQTFQHLNMINFEYQLLIWRITKRRCIIFRRIYIVGRKPARLLESKWDLPKPIRRKLPQSVCDLLTFSYRISASVLCETKTHHQRTDWFRWSTFDQIFITQVKTLAKESPPLHWLQSKNKGSPQCLFWVSLKGLYGCIKRGWGLIRVVR